MEFNDKVCLITGASSGMGKAVAAQLAFQGAKLMLNGRDTKRGMQVMDELRKNNKNVYFYPGDVGKPETNKFLVEKTIEHFGRLDVVVANAGMLGLGNITSVAMEQWHQTMSVNLNAVFYLSRFAIPAMQKTGGGVIVVNSSIAAFKSFPNHPAYCASKAGVVALAKQMALDYGPQVRVNVICPGPVDTPFIWDSAVAFPDPGKAVQAAGEKTAMKRLGTPEDIANLILFLASERASWMTGSVVTIDGGVTIN